MINLFYYSLSNQIKVNNPTVMLLLIFFPSFLWFLSDICPNSNNTTDSSDVDNIGKLSENDKQYAPANNGNNNNTLCSFDPLSISEDTDTLSDSKVGFVSS